MTDAIIINGRFKHKHDTEENWNKATNFAPLAGETIVYDPDAADGAGGTRYAVFRQLCICHP